jgi:hypothetical protein
MKAIARARSHSSNIRARVNTMRSLLALALLVLAGFLIWNGIDTEPEARVEYQSQIKVPIPNFEDLHRRFPYSKAAIDAREATLASQVAAHDKVADKGKIPGKDELKDVAREIPDKTKAGFSTEKPYVLPYSAAIVGLAGILLALVAPRTRFRGLALVGLLVGAACALAGMLPQDYQVGLVEKFSAAKYVIFNFPRVAQACLVLAAITLGARVSATRLND